MLLLVISLVYIPIYIPDVYPNNDSFPMITVLIIYSHDCGVGIRFKNFKFFNSPVLIYSCATYRLLRVQVWYDDTTPGMSDNAFTTQPLVFLTGFRIGDGKWFLLKGKKVSLASPAKA